MNHKLLTIGQVADSIGLQSWRLRQLIKRGIVSEPERVGRVRVFPASQVDGIRAAARTAGYLKPVGELAGSC